MTTSFCTLADAAYLVRVVALLESLERHMTDFVLWVLCCDDVSLDVLSRLDATNVRLMHISELEALDVELARTRVNRTRFEYYFTCKSAWVLHVLAKEAADPLVYVDADILFFSDPTPLFARLSDAAVLVVPHRFPRWMHAWHVFGKFNAGFALFRRVPAALACARWWRAQSIDWCYDRVEDGRFTDQRYLDQWPELFAGVREIDEIGAGLGTWNVRAHVVAESGKTVTVDTQRMTFFHYHGFRMLTPWLVDVGGSMTLQQRRLLARVYLRALVSARQRIDSRALPSPVLPLASNERYAITPRAFVHLLLQRRLLMSVGARFGTGKAGKP